MYVYIIYIYIYINIMYSLPLSRRELSCLRDSRTPSPAGLHPPSPLTLRAPFARSDEGASIDLAVPRGVSEYRVLDAYTLVRLCLGERSRALSEGGIRRLGSMI